ncbi:hypothetical protein I203_100413 [Kwoniella mangroviensis CBS 8507]|uniref:uncharacterized protein n=1 Tax=Kwoniella mangroviensis CBS 8507 TaxID=1296122 RepID=UPI00080D0049|nr:uncharacterized protein I203_05716 [Kwoniella mangroviensis CBS 8507]OCF64974.1 hypothetical protein I203_05716 [Kwoniella mangroviensis CBS 8507]
MAPPTPDHKSYPKTTPPSILLVILDIHPLSWSLLASPPPLPSVPDQPIIDKAQATPISLPDFVTLLMVFLNAHLASRWGNEVVVYGASAGRAKLLYPPPSNAIAGPSKPRPNTYHPFQLLDTRIEEGLKEMAEEEQRRIENGHIKSLNQPPAMVSALTKALCFVNRIIPHTSASAALVDPTATQDPSAATTTGPDKPETRILVINATPGENVSNSSSSDLNQTNGNGNADGQVDGTAPNGKSGNGGQMRGGYVGLMNCVFAAQKAKVPIDVLSLPPPSIDASPPIFLQQAAHLTEGIYWQWNGRGGLLQYLHARYLPPLSLRHHPFAVPPQDAVGFRAVCFCHHKTLDVGFVCSVCLSIFCEPRPVCLMCKTRFPIKSIPTLKSLATYIEPIPVPDTVPPPPIPKGSKAHNNNNENNKKDKNRSMINGGSGRGEPIEID